MPKVAVIDYRKPELVFLETTTSWSGKYWCFLGLHYKAGKTCYDVGASNAVTGEITRCHFNEENNFAPEAAARSYWEDTFKRIMVKPPDQPEELSELDKINEWLAIHEGPLGPKGFA